ncbi:MAG TPA: hypothetical protein DCL43_12935 [Chitinophagaceae bacterium]|nr:hypothetical protein [Chitinophagaceae bacterium]HAN38833.1 hypothetical protein [Chitinophagaceae bacterium]
MKQILLVFLSAFGLLTAYSQQTYYWNGGVNASWTAPSNWNRQLGGGGLSRSTPNAGDTLIFDGSNIGAGATGQVTVTNLPYQTVAKIIFRNGVDVRFTTSPGTAGTGTTAAGVQIGSSGSFSGQTITGTGTDFTNFFVVGDFIAYGTSNTGGGGNNAIGQITAIASATSLTQSNGILVMPATNNTATFYIKPVMIRITDSLLVEANSKFDLASSSPLIFKVNAGGKGVINGTAIISTNFQKLIADADGTASIVFNRGARFQFTGSQSTAPFDAVANATNNNIIFKAGSFYENNSVASANTNAAGNLFGAVIPRSVVQFEKGSTYVQNSTTLSSALGNAARAYPNVTLAGSTSGWQPTSPVDTLTVSSSTTWTSTSNSYFPIKGDLIIQGNFSSGGSSPVFIFCGGINQNIAVANAPASGGLARIVVASGSTLKVTNSFTQNVATNLSTNGSFIRNYGVLDFGNTVVTNLIQSQTNVLQGFSATTTVGSQTGATVAATNPYVINITSTTGFGQGMRLTGAGIPEGTVILLATSSPASLTLSNPLPAGSYDITAAVNATGSTFISAHTGGIDANYPLATGSSYGLSATPGSNFVFNAATTTPFPASLPKMGVNNLTLGAAITSNVDSLAVNGTLNLANNAITVLAGDTLRIVSGNAVQNASVTNYIRLGANNTNGSKAYLRISNVDASTVFPVGTASQYLPVTVAPAAADEDYQVSVFTGITADGTPNGTALSPTVKADLVDAVWSVEKRSTATGDATLSFGWSTALEGSAFTALANANIGISRFDAGAWGPYGTATSDNTANTASAAFGSFGLFSVGKNAQTLPVVFTQTSVAANTNGKLTVQWSVQTIGDTKSFEIEYASDGRNFSKRGTVGVNAASKYSFTDAMPVDAVAYYRIKAIGADGKVIYSPVVVHRTKGNEVAVQVYPNIIKNSTANVSVTTQVNDVITLQAIGNNGQVLTSKQVTQAASTTTYQLQINNTFKGLQFIRVVKQDGTVIGVQKIIIE